MERTRVKLSVHVDLDPIPGIFHSAESARDRISAMLLRSIPHYNPVVSIESEDVSNDTTEGQTKDLSCE